MNNIITDTDLAYIAGYIDGDGCFYIGKTTNKKTGRTRYQAILTISSTNKNILDVFKSKFGGSVRTSDNREIYPGQKPQYQFHIKGVKAANLAKNIQIYLTEKSYQAELFYKFIEIEHELLSPSTKDWLRDDKIRFIRKMKEEFYLIDEDTKYRIYTKPFSHHIIEQDYAYLAGFIDAECCLSIQHYKPKNKPNHVFKIYLACNNTRYKVFEFLTEIFGGTLSFINRKSKNPRHKNQLQWRLSGKLLAEILPFILPYLIYKKPVCEKLIEFYKLTLPNGGDRQSAAFKQFYADLLKLKMEIVNHIHTLNQKGLKHLSG